MEKVEPRSDAEVEAIVRAVLDQPPFRLCGLQQRSRGKGEAVFYMNTSAKTHNPFGGVNNGIINGAVEAPALAALLPLLRGDEHAVTVDVSISNMRPIPRDTEIELRSRVLHNGRRLAFVQTDVFAADKLCVSARITKAVVAAP
jgi:uncharacterized protein (TIGR00369 family)